VEEGELVGLGLGGMPRVADVAHEGTVAGAQRVTQPLEQFQDGREQPPDLAGRSVSEQDAVANHAPNRGAEQLDVVGDPLEVHGNEDDLLVQTGGRGTAAIGRLHHAVDERLLLPVQEPREPRGLVERRGVEPDEGIAHVQEGPHHLVRHGHHVGLLPSGRHRSHVHSLLLPQRDLARRGRRPRPAPARRVGTGLDVDDGWYIPSIPQKEGRGAGIIKALAVEA